MAIELSILLLEDNPNDAELLLYELRRSGFTPQWQRVDTAADYSAHLDDKIDLIIADYSLPDFSAVRALQVLQERGLDIPFIVVTGTVTEQIVVECMKQGASDYLLKDRLARIGSAVTHALQEKQLRDEKRKADDSLRQYAAELEQRVLERTLELQRAKEYVEAILNHTNDAIILTDTHGNIQNVNPAFESLFGYNAAEAFGQPLLILAEEGSGSLLESSVASVRGDNEPRRVEMRLRRRDGTGFAADIALASMSEEDRQRGIVCSIWDMSERKRVEENLRQALESEKELSDLKSRFTSMVSHEFRTPLAVIQSSSDLLRNYGGNMTPERKDAQLEKIQVQVQRLTALLNDILLLSRAQTIGLAFNPQPFDLCVFSQEIVNEMRLTADTHQFQFNSQGNCDEVNVDVRLMRQAITNLLSNAVKYSPVGSTVHFRLRCEHEQTILQIEDEGGGIAPEDQQHLFEVFYRAKSALSIQGTGLGLPIVKQAVEAHGGTVTFESQAGQGTIFTIYLPTGSD